MGVAPIDDSATLARIAPQRLPPPLRIFRQRIFKCYVFSDFGSDCSRTIFKNLFTSSGCWPRLPGATVGRLRLSSCP
jgi:hypothetical protein